MPISRVSAGAWAPTGLELLSEPFPDVKNDMLIEGLEKLLPDCQSGDKFRFRKRLAAQRKKKQGSDQAKVLNQLAREIRQSVNACHVRDLAIPRDVLSGRVAGK